MSDSNPHHVVGVEFLKQNGIDVDLQGKISTSIIEDQNWINSNFAARIDIGGNGADCVDIVTTTRQYCQDTNFNWQIDNGQLGNGCVYNFGVSHTTTSFVIDANCLSSGSGGSGSGIGSGSGNTGGGFGIGGGGGGLF